MRQQSLCHGKSPRGIGVGPRHGDGVWAELAQYETVAKPGGTVGNELQMWELERSLFLMGHVSSDNSLRAPMFGAQQKGAVLRQRFGAAADFARTCADHDLFADGLAMLLPFFGDFVESVGANPLIISLQFPKDVRCATRGRRPPPAIRRGPGFRENLCGSRPLRRWSCNASPILRRLRRICWSKSADNQPPIPEGCSRPVPRVRRSEERRVGKECRSR